MISEEYYFWSLFQIVSIWLFANWSDWIENWFLWVGFGYFLPTFELVEMESFWIWNEVRYTVEYEFVGCYQTAYLPWGKYYS